MSATGEYKEAIKALRASTGLSQKAFGEKFDIPKRTIENWEGGQTDPPGYVVKLIEQALEAEQAQGEVIALEEVMTEVHTYKITGGSWKKEYYADIISGNDNRWDVWYYIRYPYGYSEKYYAFNAPGEAGLHDVIDLIVADFQKRSAEPITEDGEPLTFC